MLKRYDVYLDQNALKALARIGKTKGLKLAQMIRLALAEYIEGEKSK